MCIFSFFRKIKIERNTKLKLIAHILGIMCYKMSLIEAPKLVSIKGKKRAVEGGRIIFRPTVRSNRKVIIEITYYTKTIILKLTNQRKAV